MSDVLVIGAGMAGLTAARALADAGLRATLLEARERIGGRVTSVRDLAAGPVEAGAEFIHGPEARVWPTVRAAGLAVRPCPIFRHSMLNLGGGTHWMPIALMHPGVWPAFPIMGRVRRQRPPDRTARAFLEQSGYRGRARQMAEMLLIGHAPGGLDEVGLLGLLEDGVLDVETLLNHRVADGYDRLPEALGRGLDVEHGFVAEHVTWSADGVRVRSRDGRERGARAGICTLPVGVLAGRDVAFAPALPEGKRAALESVRMGPVLKVLLRFRERFWPRWCANLVCGAGPVTLYWPVFYGTREPEPVLTAYCTGPRASGLGRAKMSEQEAVDTVLTDLARLLPKADPRGQLEEARRIDWAADPWAGGGYTFLACNGTGARARLAAPDTGALFWAGEATAGADVIAASVEAAHASGLRAAAETARHLGAG